VVETIFIDAYSTARVYPERGVGMTILVTGGAGYVGSHMVRTLLRAGRRVVVVDDLSSGPAEVVPEAVRLVRADVADRATMTRLLREERIDAVMHFAARIEVGESMRDPRRHWTGNVVASIALLDATLDAGVARFVFSSSAAVYGAPLREPIDEDHPLDPVSVYGQTKLAVERVLASYGRAYGLSWAALRYFNAAGAAPEGDLGERHEPETHLIPVVLETALGRREHVHVHGDDYPTPDGTCVRDYIHVLDLCEAHLAALDWLARGGDSGAFNLGTGKGASVREVVACAERVTGRPVRVMVGPRRPGDPAMLVASCERAARVLGWRPARVTLEEILRDAWRWHARS
jgi:UDP-glucose 4-epimerase